MVPHESIYGFIPEYRYYHVPKSVFSEYIEGSSFNKALEIFNPVNNEIELTDYQLWKVTNNNNLLTHKIILLK